MVLRRHVASDIIGYDVAESATDTDTVSLAEAVERRQLVQKT